MNTVKNKRIFVVDDDPFWTAIISELLKNLGYTNIMEFSNGRDCVDNIHLNPHLVFLDYQMDDMNGLDVLERIKNHYPGIDVIFCTAYEDLSVAINAMESGSSEYLLKENANSKEVSNMIRSKTRGVEMIPAL